MDIAPVGVIRDSAPPLGYRRRGDKRRGERTKKVANDGLCCGVPLAIPDGVKVDGRGEKGPIVVRHLDQIREVNKFVGVVLRDGGEGKEKEREEEEREV